MLIAVNHSWSKLVIVGNSQSQSITIAHTLDNFLLHLKTYENIWIHPITLQIFVKETLESLKNDHLAKGIQAEHKKRVQESQLSLGSISQYWAQ